MKLIKTSIQELFLIELSTFKDNRGEYLKILTHHFSRKKLNYTVKQISFTTNPKANTLRGFHCQIKPF